MDDTQEGINSNLKKCMPLVFTGIEIIYFQASVSPLCFFPLQLLKGVSMWELYSCYNLNSVVLDWKKCYVINQAFQNGRLKFCGNK